jgi:hypothetical protein
LRRINTVGYELVWHIGDYELVAGENYPDFVVPLAKAVSDGTMTGHRTMLDWANGTLKSCAEGE